MKDIVREAIDFATLKHQGQQYDGVSYTKHLKWVADVAERFGCKDSELIAACWLHDTIEDTPATVEEITDLFGARVGDITHRVTDEPGRNRRERHEKTYGKIKASPDALFVKLCDRIANVEASLVIADPSYTNMYKKEWKDFQRLLYTPGVCEDMWQHLSKLLS